MHYSSIQVIVIFSLVLWFVLCHRAGILLDSINLFKIDLHFRSRFRGCAIAFLFHKKKGHFSSYECCNNSNFKLQMNLVESLQKLWRPDTDMDRTQIRGYGLGYIRKIFIQTKICEYVRHETKHFGVYWSIKNWMVWAKNLGPQELQKLKNGARVLHHYLCQARLIKEPF